MEKYEVNHYEGKGWEPVTDESRMTEVLKATYFSIVGILGELAQGYEIRTPYSTYRLACKKE